MYGEGTIKSIAHRGRQVIVDLGGREVKLKVSAKETKLEGVNDRAHLKVGQAVTFVYEGRQAKAICVNKQTDPMVIAKQDEKAA